MLIGWLWTAPAAPPPASPQTADSTLGESGLPTASKTPEAASVDPAPVQGTASKINAETVVLRNDQLELAMTNEGPKLTSVKLFDFHQSLDDDSPLELVTQQQLGVMEILFGRGVFEQLAGQRSEITARETRRVELTQTVSGMRIVRELSLDETGYGAQLRVRLENRTDDVLRPQFQVALYGTDNGRTGFGNYSVAALGVDGIERQAIKGAHDPGFFAFGGVDPLFPPVDWVSVESQYFMIVVIPKNREEASASVQAAGVDTGVALLSYPAFEVPAGSYVERFYDLYIGPKQRDVVTAYSAEVDAPLLPAVDTGWSWIRGLVALFSALLKWTYTNVVSNYGVAIILLTILLRLITFPLTQRSMKSMKRLQVIAPEMKTLQEKYKDDKGKLQEEMMALYKRKGMNPLSAMGGGCLPMIIQMPFLVSLFFALQGTIELRHAPFMFWINDLSTPETLFSVAGLPIRVLPLLMGASMVLQQKMTPNPSADPQQKQMMMWMSVVFIFLFYQFPSGLVLYWFVSNVLGILQQTWVNRSGTTPAKA